ncbi:MAG: S26 family signal peptidase [Sulfurospirillaceae bacterium]|nr:S26 family signal peptidase [Sulfurospirillaceae bacterium]MDD3463455.1 S26 family signal peptidase [Sulfurospirillaceae bacterium]
MIKLFKVKGDSLYPLLKDKEVILALKVTSFFSFKIGNIVIFEKDGKAMMKKVKRIEKDGVFVEGTSPYSADSRTFGLIPSCIITHKVLFKLF